MALDSYKICYQLKLFLEYFTGQERPNLLAVTILSSSTFYKLAVLKHALNKETYFSTQLYYLDKAGKTMQIDIHGHNAFVQLVPHVFMMTVLCIDSEDALSLPEGFNFHI